MIKKTMVFQQPPPVCLLTTFFSQHGVVRVEISSRECTPKPSHFIKISFVNQEKNVNVQFAINLKTNIIFFSSVLYTNLKEINILNHIFGDEQTWRKQSNFCGLQINRF